MSSGQLASLFYAYWPYIVGALVIGLVAGWFSYSASTPSP